MFGFDARTTSNVKWAVKHPLRFAWRMLNVGNIDFDKEFYVGRTNQMVDGALSVPFPDRAEYLQEIEWLKMNRWSIDSVRFPYDVIGKGIGSVQTGKDDDSGLPYVVHKNSRLFFKKGTPLSQVEKEYRYFVNVEGLTGDGVLKKSPHAYVGTDFMPERDDIILDVGCAEGLFSLEYAPQASHVYLFESDKTWRSSLLRTFEPFRSKTTIVSKYVSSQSSKEKIRLEDAVKCDVGAHFFLKMDIEGSEVEVIRSSLGFLTSNLGRISCCTYHRQSDAGVISELLTEIGYDVSYSEGYMLMTMNGVRYPYFRHGVLWASNLKRGGCQ